MAEYIGREKALAFPFANGHYDSKNAISIFILGCESYREYIESIPAADVRPVVICENCKHCLKLDEHESWCKVHSPMHLVRPDDWCSRGEEVDNG